MKLLFVGDIVGKPGRQILRRALPLLVRRHRADLVIANVENAAGGFGITKETAEEILATGVHVMTTGNHVWDKREALDYIERETRLLRPLNFPGGAPGRGSLVTRTDAGVPVAVVNGMGRVHMAPLDNPFATLSREVERLRAETPVILVDFHAEATSEKIAMGWHLAGRVTAVLGTHTHVQTADERVLPGGTAYLTDVGMTGPHDGVIGVDKDAALGKFLTGLPSRFDTASGDPRLNAVVIEVDPLSGHALGIERLSIDAAAAEAMAGMAAAAAI